jgi:hypothetical protein
VAVSGLVITGELAIVNVTAVEVAPQVFPTVIEAVPALAIRDAGTVAVSCVEETNVVASDEPFQFTVAPVTKFVPVTVNVNCGPPGATHVGSIELIVGAALMAITRVAVAVLQGLAPLVAVITTLVVPAVVGAPEMTFRFCPVPNDRPGGNGDAV